MPPARTFFSVNKVDDASLLAFRQKTAVFCHDVVPKLSDAFCFQRFGLLFATSSADSW